MAERTLRGARLGGQSFEDERGIEFAARQQVGYRCDRGHEFEITMSVEAEIPANWVCPRMPGMKPPATSPMSGNCWAGRLPPIFTLPWICKPRPMRNRPSRAESEADGSEWAIEMR